MTFDDDSLCLETLAGRRYVPCRDLGLEWPPPETVDIGGFVFKQESISSITDEQRQKMTHVFRAALYRPEGSS